MLEMMSLVHSKRIVESALYFLVLKPFAERKFMYTMVECFRVTVNRKREAFFSSAFSLEIGKMLLPYVAIGLVRVQPFCIHTTHDSKRGRMVSCTTRGLLYVVLQTRAYLASGWRNKPVARLIVKAKARDRYVYSTTLAIVEEM